MFKKGDISRKNSERNQKINTKGTPSKPLNNTTEELYDEANKATNDLVSLENQYKYNTEHVIRT